MAYETRAAEIKKESDALSEKLKDILKNNEEGQAFKNGAVTFADGMKLLASPDYEQNIILIQQSVVEANGQFERSKALSTNKVEAFSALAQQNLALQNKVTALKDDATKELKAAEEAFKVAEREYSLAKQTMEQARYDGDIARIQYEQAQRDAENAHRDSDLATKLPTILFPPLAIATLIGEFKDLANEPDKRSEFTKSMVTQLVAKNPNWSAICVHTSHSISGRYIKFHEEFPVAFGRTVGFDIYMMRFGDDVIFNLHGDAGFLNWAFGGRFNRNDRRVEFF